MGEIFAAGTARDSGGTTYKTIDGAKDGSGEIKKATGDATSAEYGKKIDDVLGREGISSIR